MKRIILLAILMSASAVQSATPAPNPAPPVPKRFPGVSDAGNAVLAKAQTTPDAQLQTIVRQQRAAHDQIMSAVMAPVIDVDKFAAALRVEEVAQNEAHARSNDRLIAVVKQLPEEDRGTFLRTLMMARAARPAGTPAPSPQP